MSQIDRYVSGKDLAGITVKSGVTGCVQFQLALLSGGLRRMASPPLLRQKRQVVVPILLFHADRVNDVGQIVGGVGEHPRGMIYGIAAVAQGSRFLRRIHIRGKLSRLDGSFAAGGTDKALVKVVEPCPQYLPGIAIGICGHEDDLEPARLLRWHLE
jgi:hypothetical protein